MKKKILSIVVIVAMVLICVGNMNILAANASGTTGEVNWALSGSVLNIYGTGAMEDYASISSAPWYKYSSDITAINIQSGVTSIGNCAFAGNMKNVTAVNIANTVKVIGSKAFYLVCPESITIPDSVVEIKREAFSPSAKVINVGKGLKTFAPDAFGTRITRINVSKDNEYFCSVDGVLFTKDMTRLVRYPAAKSGDEYVIPETVEVIGENAFNYAVAVKTLTIPKGVTAIENNAFFRSEGIERVNIESLENWCKISFGNISTSPVSGDAILYVNGKEIKHLVIPEGVTEIAPYAFNLYGNLQSVTIPKDVEIIGECAFRYCSGLETVYMSSTVEEIGNSAFAGNSILKKVYYQGSEAQWSVLDFNYGRYNASLFDGEITFNYLMPSIDSVTTEGENVNITLSDHEAGGIVLTVLYNGDMVKKVLVNEACETVSVEIDEYCVDKAKVIWLESMESLKPLCASKDVKLPYVSNKKLMVVHKKTQTVEGWEVTGFCEGEKIVTMHDINSPLDVIPGMVIAYVPDGDKMTEVELVYSTPQKQFDANKGNEYISPDTKETVIFGLADYKEGVVTINNVTYTFDKDKDCTLVEYITGGANKRNIEVCEPREMNDNYVLVRTKENNPTFICDIIVFQGWID